MESISNIHTEVKEESYSEIILYDILHNIFHYLNIYDLNHAAMVCKSWYRCAMVEKLKRGPQIMILQALDDLVATGFTNTISADKCELPDDFKASLRVKPKAGIFFTDGKYPASADCDSVSYEICVGYKWTQPDNCIYVAIETLGVALDNNAIGGERNLTAAVLLPELPTVNYAIAQTNVHCIKQYFKGEKAVLDNIADKIFTNGSHLCFIIFIYQWDKELTYQRYHNHFLTDFLSNIKSRYCKGAYSLWGGTVNDIFTVIPDITSSYHSSSFYALSISGATVQSWSIVLKNNLPDSEIQQRLHEFKKFVQEKTSVAFLMIPKNENHADKSKIDIFKDIFPTTKFINVFSNKNNAVFSVDSTSNEVNPVLKHTNSYAFMILNYKL